MLQPNGITRLVDVRTVPRSRANPQYNKDTLPAELARHGIAYEHIAALGGLRGRDRQGTPPEVNGFWENQGFHNYADYAMTPAFRAWLKTDCAALLKPPPPRLRFMMSALSVAPESFGRPAA